MSLFTEFADRPNAVGTKTPRFSWQPAFRERDRKQAAYQILIASSESKLQPGQADLWDSGKVESAQSVNVAYAGKPLQSNRDYVWSVRYWDDKGNDFCDTSSFSTALFDEEDWQAAWIGMGDPDEPFPDVTCYQRGGVTPELEAFEPDSRAPLLRKTFDLEKGVKRARVFVCGMGLFDLHLNGNRFNEDVLTTPRTDFRERALYRSYDVTKELYQGKNVLGLVLGNGWFNGQKKYWGWQMQWYGSPRAILQLEIDYADGSQSRIISDASWKGSWSPISFNCIYDGEHYDARLEQDDWDKADFDDSTWDSVTLPPAPGGKLEAMRHEAERIVERFKPVSVKEPEAGVFVIDTGKNITGWLKINIRNGKAGDSIRLHYGEAQHHDGSLNASSNNAALQEDQYIMKGSAEESFEPHFTFHGFQFVEIKGYPGKLKAEDIEVCFARTAVAQTGNFECDNELINKIHRCTLQSQLCNVQMGVPTDDTQRPERLGWGADAWGTAKQALYNLWMPRVYQKWIRDLADQQHKNGSIGMIAPQAGSQEDLVWSAAFILIPWWQYIHYGDKGILEENYPAFKNYLDYLEKTGTSKVEYADMATVINSLLWDCDEEDRFPPADERGHLQISQWGDHLATADGHVARHNLPLSIATAFYYQDVKIMADIAEVLGHEEDAAIYRERSEKIKAAFNERFFNKAMGYYDEGMQSAQAWPLVFGLVPDEHLEQVKNYFIRLVSKTQRHLTTGYASTRYAIEALSMLGHDDEVWKLATATSYPSWGYMLRLNRTTSCERWDGEAGSLNHAPLGAAIDEWFYWGLAGIRPSADCPGFEKIIFKPFIPTDLSWAKASIESIRGHISSAWEHDGKRVSLKISVPANSCADVYIPGNEPDQIKENGKAITRSDEIKVSEQADTYCCLTIGSGDFTFTFPLTQKQ